MNIAVVTSTFANNSVSLFTIRGGISRASGDTTARTLSFAGPGNTTVSGGISNGGASAALALAKEGLGRLTLTAASSFSSGVQVNAGTVVAGGANNTFSTLGTGTVAIGSSGTVQLSWINTTNGGYAAGYTNAVSGSWVLMLLYPSTGDGNNCVTSSGNLPTSEIRDLQNRC